MSGNEIEPYIAKGVKLALSNDEDSLEQLRLMLEETVRAKYGAKKAQAIANLANRQGQQYQTPQTYKRRLSVSESDEEVEDEDEEEEEEEDDDEEDAEEEVPAKRRKFNDSNKTSGTSSPALTFENESSNVDSEDFSMEILEDSVCLACRSAETTPRNSIVECMDCHSLYHQNCVNPPIEADVNDPRFVWYCKSCSKGSKKGSPSASSSRASSAGASSGSSVTSSHNSSNSNHISSNSNSGNSVKSSSSKSPTANTSRSNSQSPSYTMGSKPFSNKFRLFKAVKR